jgi:hypothetical protein
MKDMEATMPLPRTSLCGLIGAFTLLAVSASGQVVGTIGSTGGGVIVSQAPIGSQIMTPGMPAGKIGGKVVDENGNPVLRATVQAWAEVIGPDGQRRQMGNSMRSTDDQGQFTLDRLQPGEYFVVVFPSQIYVSPLMPEAADGMSYPNTYYPGVTAQAQAQKVTASTSPQPITIRVRRVKAFHLRGTLTSPTGRSTQGMRVQAVQSIGFNRMTHGTAVVGSDGSFDMAGITPGAYTISATTAFADMSGDFATKDVELVDRDLEGITLSLTPGGVINGRIMLEPPTRTPAPLALLVTASPGAPKPGEIRPTQFLRPAQVNADWTFQVRGLNGLYRFNLQMESLPDFAVVRTVFDGRDVGNTLEVSVTQGTHQLVFHLARKP